MKLKIKITGPKIHDVGYRPWLTELAMNTALRGFEVYNDEENGQQAVIALAEADDPRIKRFLNTVKTTQPQLAKVSGVTSEEYTDEIMPVWQAATIGSFTQLNKAIPLLLGMNQTLGDMNGKMDKMLEKQDKMLGKQDVMIGKQDQTIEEISGLREDLVQNTNKRLDGIERDMRVVKTKLGIR